MDQLCRYNSEFATYRKLRIEYGKTYDVELNVWQAGCLLDYCKKSRIEPYQACEYILQKAANNFGRFKYEFLDEYVCLPSEYMQDLKYSFYKPEDKEFSKSNYSKIVDFYNEVNSKYTNDELIKLSKNNNFPTINIKARTITVSEVISYWERMEMERERKNKGKKLKIV